MATVGQCAGPTALGSFGQLRSAARPAAPAGGVIRNLRQLWRYRELLALWTMREIKVRYKQSVLGAGWAILQPLALMLMFNFVFTMLVRIPTDGLPYAVFSYTALLPWTFFAGSLGVATTSLINNINLITKVYFPREILPLAVVGAALLDFLVATTLLVGVLVWYHVPLTWTLAWVPVLLLLEIMLVVGIVLPLAAITVFYRDVRFVVPLVVQLLLYASPVIYPISLVPEHFRAWYALNPMVGIIDSLRRTVALGQTPEPLYLGFSAVISVALVVFGYSYFKRVEGQFADLI